MVGTQAGFALAFTSGFGDGAIRTSGIWTTADGSEWEQAEALDGAFVGRAVVGDTILAPLGRWVIEFDDDGNGASESFESNGNWLIVTTNP